MLKALIIGLVIALAAVTTNARYADAQTAPVVEPMAKPSVILAQADAVCAGTFVLSAAATTACAAKAYPKVIKDGSRFQNTGTGAEFNTLIRQLKN